MFSEPAEAKAHQELDDGGEDGHGGLRAAHEVAGDEGHDAGLRDYSAEGPAEAKENLDERGAEDEGDKGCGHVPDREYGHYGDVEWHAEILFELAGDDAARDRPDSPAGFEITETCGARMKNVVGERDEDDVRANDSGHHDGMGDQERADDRLLFQVVQTFLEIGFEIFIHRERKTGFGDFGTAGGRFERFGSVLGGFGKFASAFQVSPRRDVALADFIETVSGDEIGAAVDG